MNHYQPPSHIQSLGNLIPFSTSANESLKNFGEKDYPMAPMFNVLPHPNTTLSTYNKKNDL